MSYLAFWLSFIVSMGSIWAVYANVVTVCTWLHNILPPWEFLDQFPTAQKYYKLLVYLIGYAAGSARSTIWSSISTNDGKQPSEAAQKKNGAG